MQFISKPEKCMSEQPPKMPRMLALYRAALYLGVTSHIVGWEMEISIANSYHRNRDELQQIRKAVW